MKYYKNPVLKFCLWFMWKIACECKNPYYCKQMKKNLANIKHYLSVMDRGINIGNG